MEIRKTETATELVLSRRNLESLLTKLDHPGSAKTIYYDDPEHGRLIVVAEDDDEHYKKKGTTPGAMHPQTESDIRARRA